MPIIAGEAADWPSMLGATSRLELRGEKEDWIGKTRSSDRRKLQNRLNQRAHRRRTNAKREAVIGIGKAKLERRETDQDDVVPAHADTTDLTPSHPSMQVTPRKPGCIGAAPRAQDIMQQFAEHAYMSYMQGKPSLLHLPLLARYNVSIALEHNADMLGMTKEYFEWDGVSPFAKGSCLGNADTHTDPANWSANMLPTPLQRSKPHHPWVDAFPWPQMRDNMMEAFDDDDICNEDEMCREVVEYDGHNGEPLLLVWGDASNPQNWEIGYEILKKWVWLLRGCEGLLEATNHWRAKRGEKPISQKLFNAAIEQSMPPRLRASEL